MVATLSESHITQYPAGPDGISIGGLDTLTDNSGGTAGTTIAAGVGRSFVAFFVNLSTLANGDVLTTFTPGFAGRVVSVDFRVHAAVTTGSKAATLNLEIGTTNLTGGVVALTSATCTPAGAAVAGSAVTAANTFTATDSLSIEASSVTAFAEGTGWLIVTLQNDDLRNALASLIAQHNVLV